MNKKGNNNNWMVTHNSFKTKGNRRVICPHLNEALQKGNN